MNNFIISIALASLVLLASIFYSIRLYREMAVILEAKRIHEKMKQDHFWATQESFEE